MIRTMANTFLCVALLASLVTCQSSFSPARPPAVPLAVRGPYLSTWQAAGASGSNGGYLAGQWPSFWNGATTGWTGLIRVDNTTYTWMGNPNPLPQVATQTSFGYTSTRSIYEFDVGGVIDLRVTFLSPVTPDDMLRQSAPVSYMVPVVQSKDGKEHDVKIYTDISAEWASGDRSQTVEWSYGTTSGGNSVAYHHFALQDQAAWSEVSDQAQWGDWYYSSSNANGLTHQSGADGDVRSQFINNGSLSNAEDTNYRAINDRYPVFGFAMDYGQVGSSSKNTVFSVFLAQQDPIQFDSGSGLQPVPSYWLTQHADNMDALAFFHNDFSNVFGACVSLDQKIQDDAMAAEGQDYLTIVSLAVRQVFGALHLVGDAQTQYLFMKEISSNGNVNTVDVIFPASPMLFYLNPTLVKLLLDPVYLVQQNGMWPEKFAIHDIGFHYPNATGHTSSDGVEDMPLEESGNMLILTLAYAQRSGDTGYISSHYTLLKQWADVLVQDALIPASQISTDDFVGALANQTNLALKGIIALEAMSMLANMTGQSSDGADYSNTAHDYIAQWQTLGIARDATPSHTTLAYGQNDTHGLLYNLYADSLVQTNLVPRSVYQMQSDFYPTVFNKYGVPLDTRVGYTKSDWQMWCAAVSDTNTRNEFIQTLATWINETPTDGPATDLFETDTGEYWTGPPFLARPVVGGWFSLLALNSTGTPS